MKIEFKQLNEIEKSQIISLMNNSLVRRQMPLLKDDFTEVHCDQFLKSKEEMWKQHGIGPWAFVIDDEFAGWGGLQDENGKVDLAIVLHPNYWGAGKVLYKKIMDIAIHEYKFNTIQVLFPTSRTRVKGLLSLGFVKEEEVMLDNEHFIRYVYRHTDQA